MCNRLTWKGFAVSRYWSNFDKDCQPRLDPPTGSVAEIWVLGEGLPLQRFTGSVHDLGVNVPSSRVTSDAPVTQVMLVIQTGSDDLRGGRLNNVNAGRNWKNWSANTVAIPLPDGGLKGGEVKTVTLHTGFGGGISGDNWNVNRLQLQATLK